MHFQSLSSFRVIPQFATTPTLSTCYSRPASERPEPLSSPREGTLECHKRSKLEEELDRNASALREQQEALGEREATSMTSARLFWTGYPRDRENR